VLALAVALVIATKELIQCVLGTVFRASTRMFSLGDRVEVGEIRGDVIDHGILGTTILEVGPDHQRTGRALTLPNNMFLTTPVINETHTQSFVLHLMTIPLREGNDWKRAEEIVLRTANDVCGAYLSSARDNMEQLARRHGLVPRSAEPQVMVQLAEPERVNLLLRIPIPVRDKGRVEQAFLRGVLDDLVRG
jgi:small-conductance mechanosensitive channel